MRALGIDTVWLGPYFPSPNVDNGYDISDYRGVMAEFGTMAGFGRMSAGKKARGIRLIIDLVVNHSSDRHPWSRQARQGPDNRYRDYCIRRPGKAAGLPNNDPAAMLAGPNGASRDHGRCSGAPRPCRAPDSPRGRHGSESIPIT